MTQAKQHQRHVGARFSAAAHTYGGASGLQNRVARAVMSLVPGDLEPGLILDAGCGTGSVMMLARRRWPQAELVGVDIASGMIEAARHGFAGDERVTLVEGDMTTFENGRPFDLILSSSSLHWLRPFGRGLEHMAGLCRPGGLLAIGMMLDGTLRELREAREAIAPHKAAPGRLPSLREVESAARSIGGIRVIRCEQATEPCFEDTASDVLRSLHHMGVTGGDVSRGEKPLSRGEIKALAEWYDRHYRGAEGVRMTFQVGYLLMERI